MFKKTLAVAAMAAAFVSSAFAETVKTDFFTVDLPQGWVNNVPIKKTGPSYQTSFGNPGIGAAISLVITPDGKSDAESDAKGSHASFKNKMKVGEIQEKDGIYYYDFEMGPGNKGIFYAVEGDDVTVSFLVMGNKEEAYKLIDSFTDCDEEAFRTFE